jgi:hypothetical protein
MKSFLIIIHILSYFNIRLKITVENFTDKLNNKLLRMIR